MFYTIYKTINLINGKFYIGKHQTKNLNDGYLGSGKLLKRAISKYGIDNFHKEILYICESEKQMNALEKILVVPDSELNYNLCDGGKGGFSFINKKMTDQSFRVRGANAAWNKGRDKILAAFERGRKSSQTAHRETVLKNLAKGRYRGSKHNDASKRKIGNATSIHQSGSGNSQYGTCWITNNIENKKIKKEELDFWIKLGYNKGRINKNTRV